MNDNKENEDWMEGVHHDDSLTEQDFDDPNDVPTRWDRNHDFFQLHQEHMEPLNMQDIETRCKRKLESARVINRRSVSKKNLNQQQEIAHDLIVKALKLSTGEYTTHSGNDVSRLQLSLGKGGTGKTHALEVVIATFKENDNCVDENFLVMAPTGKAASNMCGSTLQLNKEGLRIPVKKSRKKLEGKKLAHHQEKCKGKLKLVVTHDYHTSSKFSFINYYLF